MRTAVRAVAVILAVGAVAMQWRSRSDGRALEQVRDQALEARDQAQACVLELAISEARFQRLRQEVDSLRGRVTALESLDSRGVPAERYDEYLSTVDAFNDGVRLWEDAAAQVRATEARCRASVDGYNALADSLRAGGTPPSGDP